MRQVVIHLCVKPRYLCMVPVWPYTDLFKGSGFLHFDSGYVVPGSAELAKNKSV